LAKNAKTSKLIHLDTVVPQINSNSTNPLIYHVNSFSTSSYVATQSKKYADLNEYCTTILSSKIPKIFTKVF
jgi:hypothetical protein